MALIGWDPNSPGGGDRAAPTVPPPATPIRPAPNPKIAVGQGDPQGNPGGGNVNYNYGNQGGGGGNQPTPPPGSGGGTATYNYGNQPGNYGSTPQNFGLPMDPWNMPYQGNFTAPMSPYELNALGGYNQFVQGGMGLNPGNTYYNNELGGQYLNLNSNPYLQQIQTAMQGIKNYQDTEALNRIGSSMALGGNALSGARLGASNDYMNQSNNQFNALMGQLMNQNYGMERGLMNQAPGGLANLANTASGGYSQLFGMGALPRSLSQNDLNAAYQDFLRQSGNMQTSAHYPDQQILQLLAYGRYPGQYQPTYGSSILDQIAGNIGGSNIDWGSILGSLFGGGGASADGVPVGYDGELFMGHDSPAPGTSGPANYWDTNWYQAQIDANKAKQAQIAANAAKGPNTTVPAILTLLLSMLGKKGGKSGGGTSGGSGSPGSKSTGRGLLESIFSHNPYPAGSDLARQWDQQFHWSGAPMTPAPSADLPINTDIGHIGYTPDNPLSGGGTGSFSDIYNNMNPIPDYTITNAENPPNIPIGGSLNVGGGGGDAYTGDFSSYEGY